MASKKSRGFCITIYDYAEKIEFCKKFFGGDGTYFCMGQETTKKGNEHLQCFVRFANPRACGGVLKMIKKSILDGANVRPAKETDADWQAMYCMKEGGYFYEHGDRNAQGKRNDLSEIRGLLLKTGKMRDIVEETENFQSVRSCEKYLSYKETKRNWVPIVIWLYGSTGVGKSRMAREICDPNDTWENGEDLTWFDGYDAHKYMIFDDFRKTHCSYNKMLKLLDRYPMKLAVKGGFREILSTHIVITSNKHPVELFDGLEEEIDQLMRRLTIVAEVTQNGTDVMEQKSGVILAPDLCSILKIENK